MAHLWSTDRLLHHIFPRAFLIEPIIPQGGIVFFYGKRNIGKSQFALTLVSSLVEHGILFGRYPTHPHGSVVYVQSDMTASIEQERVKKIIVQYPRLSNLYFFFPNFFNLLNHGHTSEVVQEIVALNPSLIVWDTLRKIHRLDGNSDETPSTIYSRCKELFPTTTHMFIHHDKKTIADQEKLDEEELFRGSGAWLDDADTGIHLSSVASGKLMCSFTKVRTCEPQAPIPLTLHYDNLLLYAGGDQILKLAEHWRRENPNGRPHELERFLLASFVGSPRTVNQLIHEKIYA